MPAKKVISRERIIEEALKIVRKEGMDGLNMRTLAKACNCSTQPLYLSFSGAEELKSALNEKIVQTYRDFLETEVTSGRYPEYKATGMGYIRFAKEESELFKYLFMRDRRSENSDEIATDFEHEAARLKNYSICGDTATKIHTHMWVWVHGIATMYATGYMNWEWEVVSEMLTDAFLGIKARLTEGV